MKSHLFKLTILMLMVVLLFSSFAFTVSADATAPNLGSASPFGLMGVSISNSNPTLVAGSIGSDGQTSAPTITVGANFLNDATYHTANLDLGLAIDNVNAQACTSNGQAGDDIGGQIFQTGVHCYPGAVNVTGTVKLDGPGVIIFKVDGAFDTAANAVFELTNGASAANVFYVVSGASTLGANTIFLGSLMSKAAITVDTSNIVGRILSQPAVTISTSTITVPLVQQNLVLSEACTNDPQVHRNWNVHNPNAAAINFSYAIHGTSQLGSQTIAANGDVQISTTTEGTNVMDLLVNGTIQTFFTSAGSACAVATASPTTAPTAAPTSTPTTVPTTAPTAVPTTAPTAAPIAAPTTAPVAATTPSPIATPGPCLSNGTTVNVKPTAVPAGAKLISKNTSELMIWLLPNGSLVVKANLPEKTKDAGIWSFDLGGQIYTVNGSEGVTYTIANPPVGTYNAAASFASDCGQPIINLMGGTIKVPTVTGGTLPNTSTPWYNIMLLGTVILLIGTIIWRKRKLRD
jgi:LPXTG-motif cell wall-anchored protein